MHCICTAPALKFTGENPSNNSPVQRMRRSNPYYTPVMFRIMHDAGKYFFKKV